MQARATLGMGIKKLAFARKPKAKFKKVVHDPKKPVKETAFRKFLMLIKKRRIKGVLVPFLRLLRLQAMQSA